SHRCEVESVPSSKYPGPVRPRAQSRTRQSLSCPWWRLEAYRFGLDEVGHEYARILDGAVARTANSESVALALVNRMLLGECRTRSCNLIQHDAGRHPRIERLNLRRVRNRHHFVHLLEHIARHARTLAANNDRDRRMQVGFRQRDTLMR